MKASRKGAWLISNPDVGVEDDGGHYGFVSLLWRFSQEYFQASSIRSLAVLVFFVVFLAGLRRCGTFPLSVTFDFSPLPRSVTRACAVLELLSRFSKSTAGTRCRCGFVFALTRIELRNNAVQDVPIVVDHENIFEANVLVVQEWLA